MYRRWQKDAVDRYRTLESLNTFLARVKPLSGPNQLHVCDPADLYAVQSVLHSKDRNPELHMNGDPGFYYFLADTEQTTTSSATSPAPASGVPAVSEPGMAASPAANGSGTIVRREAVVPVGSKCTQLTPALMCKFFQLEAHPNTGHVLLGIVDDDGSVSLIRIFNYLQPPFEGPEALPPLEGQPGVGGESDEEGG